MEMPVPLAFTAPVPPPVRMWAAFAGRVEMAANRAGNSNSSCFLLIMFRMDFVLTHSPCTGFQKKGLPLAVAKPPDGKGPFIQGYRKQESPVETWNRK